MFPPIDTKNPEAVAHAVRVVHARLFPGASAAVITRLFQDVQRMFEGQYLDYGPVDLAYHDFQHTLQATLCMAELLEGRQTSGEAPLLEARNFDQALAAVMLHDTGYLKLRADASGTGAKYTYTHVLRSCAVAASYLPSLGFTLEEIDGVLGAIRCTGPTAAINRLHFRNPTERLIGCCVATADYLGQMAAADYPDELPILFREFEESDDFLHVPADRRIFKSAEDLISKTPKFWRKIVQPKLHDEMDAVYRYLARPYPDGANAYLKAVERNLKLIESPLPT